MNITITPENIYFFSVMVLMALQIYQHRQLDKTKKEMDKIWEQISTWNTMVALKLLENQNPSISIMSIG
jgi:uncharacterized membrane protein YiaA